MPATRSCALLSPQPISPCCPAVDSALPGSALAGGGATDARRALSSSTDLAATLDDAQSGSSTAALHDELAEKNRIIERLQVRCVQRQCVAARSTAPPRSVAHLFASALPLQRKLEKMQRQQQEQQQQTAAVPASSGRSTEEERLRQAVASAAGAFRDMQLAGAAALPPARGGSHPLRGHASPAASVGGSGMPHAVLPTIGSSGIGSAAGAAAAPGGLEELRRREQALAARESALAAKQAELEEREQALAACAAAVPAAEPEPPILPAGLAHAAAAADASPVQQPESVSRGGDGSGGADGSAAAEGSEWTTEFEQVRQRALLGVLHSASLLLACGTPALRPWQRRHPAAKCALPPRRLQGVFLTLSMAGGAPKLTRIRFSRSLYSADSAKQVGCRLVRLPGHLVRLAHATDVTD